MLSKIAVFAAISLGITLAIALGLIASQPTSEMTGEGGLDFDNTLAAGAPDAPATHAVPMRDGYELQVRRYAGPSPDAPLLVLVHGSGWHGLQFDGLAKALSSQVEVLVPDLRGHGAAPGRRGDVDYIGQFEDDLADLINASAPEGRSIIMGGHSSGGGLVIRFAGGTHGAMMDKAVLLAPFLKHNAPTMRPNSGSWTQALTRRIIGLSMLNALRIRALNHLTIIQFNMPRAVLEGPLGDTATTAYSYRLNTSFAPRGDYLKDIAALPPFLLVAGTADEAFDAARYEPTMAAVSSKGQYLLVGGVGHLDIVMADETLGAMQEFLGDE